MDARESFLETIAAPKTPRPSSFDEAAKAKVYRQFLQGISIGALAQQSGRSVTGITRAINELRAKRLLETKLEAMPNESFDDPRRRPRSWPN